MRLQNGGGHTLSQLQTTKGCVNNSRFPDHSKELDMQLTGLGGTDRGAGGDQAVLNLREETKDQRDPDRHVPLPKGPRQACTCAQGAKFAEGPQAALAPTRWLKF